VELISFILRSDAALSAWVVAHRLGALDGVMWTLSAIGRGGAVFVAAGLALAAGGRIAPRGLVRLLAAVLLATATADYVVKPVVNRQRPFAQDPTIRVIGGRPNDASFPSGHAANAFAGALMLSRLVPAGQAAWWALAAAIAVSRVYLGVHYPLDVLGGAAIGLACAMLASRAWRRADGALHIAAPYAGRKESGR
jgi:undecaprenyl-diphosphatase